MVKTIATSEKEAINNLEKYFELEEEDFEVNESGSVIEIDLSSNNLEVIPIILFEFPLLQILRIHGTKIRKIENLEKLSNLVELHLYGNLIKKIEGLENLSQLRVLNLGYNQINKIEGLENLSQLQQLQLEGNNIGKIENLEPLTQLIVLRLEANEIKKIEGLDKLTMLQELELSDNKIQKIEDLENLSQLKILNIRLNEIKKIEGLENLSQLNTLDLTFNDISKFEGLSNCPELKNLKLDKENLRKKDQILYEGAIQTVGVQGEQMGMQEVAVQGEQQVITGKEALAGIHIPKLKFEEQKDFEKELELMSSTNINILRNEILATPDNKRADMIKNIMKNRKKLNKTLMEYVSEIDKLLKKERPSYKDVFEKMDAVKSIYEELGNEDRAEIIAIEIDNILNNFDSIIEKKELSKNASLKINEAKAALGHRDKLKAALLYRVAARLFLEIGNHQLAEQLKQESINCEFS